LNADFLSEAMKERVRAICLTKRAVQYAESMV